MASESLKEFKKMDASQLAEREKELRDQLYRLRTQGATEKVKDVSQFKKIRKDIARIMTIRRSSEIAGSKK